MTQGSEASRNRAFDAPSQAGVGGRKARSQGAVLGSVWDMAGLTLQARAARRAEIREVDRMAFREPIAST
ncbi:hypothetical protein GCM10017620_15480 [Brevundimonas intermedia]|uniref:Uncharacterized protein n=1 Tax=Brevundimonas intermedia TaxID=74315 RepID=A0ABQ5T909_9CAUL|nr:hypothetical protein GCM10017620_15480 [Brevundimonas intermedia]